jgi:signal transduction histidine kinase/ActR/RegA family two-component response regulator
VLIAVLRIDPALGRLRDVGWYVLVGVLSTTLIGASVGTMTITLSGGAAVATAPRLFLEWWLGDAGGVLVVGSLLLVGVRGRPAWGWLLSNIETWLVLAALGLAASLAFLPVLPEPWPLAASQLAFPILAWAGLRLGPRGAVLAAATWSALVVVGVVVGTSPASGGSPVVVAFALGTAAAVTGMLLAAARTERNEGFAALQASARESARLSAQVEHLQRLEGLGLLAGGIAHDFNNLLVPVRTNAELLHDVVAPNTAAFDMLRDIESAAETASDLCQQLLTYAGQRQMTIGPVPLAQIIAEMRRLLVTSIPSRVRFIVDIEDGLPEVDGDASQLRQVVLNLVVNAAEAIGKDRDGRVRLSLRLEQPARAAREVTVLGLPPPSGPYLALEVSDDGPGMDAETAARVFDPFFTTKFKGRGLGLAAVLGIVKAHDGAIAMSTAPGRGTRLRVLLPPSAETSIPPIDDEPVLEPTRGLRVLLVDDDQAVLNVARRVLRRDGHQVATARDGLEAVATYERQRDSVDIVVIDVTMPGLDGPAALRLMRKIRPDLPAVLLSGFDEHGVAATLDGNTAFMKKPFRAAELNATVRRVVATAWTVEV